MTQLGSKGKDPLEPVHMLVPTIPPSVSDAIQKAMAISSNDRFATVDQFWQALNAYPLWQEPVPPVIPAVSPSATTEVNPKDGKELAPASLHKQQAVATPLIETVPTRTATTRMATTRKRRFLPFLLVLAALAIGLGVVGAFWSYAGGRSAPSPVATRVVQHKASATAQSTAKSGAGTTPTATPTRHRAVPPIVPTPTPTAIPTPTANPTPVSPAYPQVGGTHYGSVHNTTAGINANMSVTLYQNRGSLSGNVVINPPLQGSGPIIYGLVQTNNNIQFTVQGYNGGAPLFFYGTVNSNGSMGGSYCSLDASTQQCSAAAGGQGTWFVNASSGPGSFSFSSESNTTKTRL
jgi:hypothetical protein